MNAASQDRWQEWRLAMERESGAQEMYVRIATNADAARAGIEMLRDMRERSNAAKERWERACVDEESTRPEAQDWIHAGDL
jgi:hypothetical protein